MPSRPPHCVELEHMHVPQSHAVINSKGGRYIQGFGDANVGGYLGGSSYLAVRTCKDILHTCNLEI